ncbi:nonsense-mediated mRNA decay factor SMG7-like [Silene latifolia]|uniref:nonsense-mediated mRNA decay factor SMG7-like n=1 Tax=Silene latifolia TaxID=37657 RepID=UPI003D77E825
MIDHMEKSEKTSNSSSRERAEQLFKKNAELEKKRQKSLQAKIPSDPNTWNQIRENYEAIILEDHAFSEQRGIELSVWQLHYKRIEEFRALFNSAQASARSSAANNLRGSRQLDIVTKLRVQFKAFLSEAAGFYHDLILKIRAKYGLPLGHFSDNSDGMVILGNDSAQSSDVKKAVISCHRCLIYLGDLARYKGMYGEGESRAREFSAASSYYLQATALWPSNGNPHHQLAILSTYRGDELVAVYRYFRSLAIDVPFPTAKDNLFVAFDKNRQSYNQQLETRKNNSKGEATIKEKYKVFCNQFVRLHGILYSRTSLETFHDVLSSVTEVLHELLSSGPEEKQNFGGDGTENEVVILRIAATLIFTVYNVNKKTEGQTYAEILQHNVLYENACSVTFELMGLIVERCAQLHDPSSSFLLPGILVFLEWLACCPDIATCAIDQKKISAAKMSFWKHCIALLNKLLSSSIISVDDNGDETCFTNMSRYEEGGNDSQLALGEDFELRGFSPLLPAQSILDFSRKHSPGVGGSNKERRTRVKRIIAAGKALTSVAMVEQKAVSFDSNMKQFIIGTQSQVPENIPSSLMMRESAQLIFEGEDEDEEIVFKPVFVEKPMDAVGLTNNSFEVPEKVKSPPPRSDNIPPQVHPARDLHNHNSTWLPEPQSSVADGIKNLRFVENELVPPPNMKGNLVVQNAGPLFPPDTGMYSEYKRSPDVLSPSNMNSTAFFEVKPPLISTTFKSQGSRPVRHLGPPPGFSHVPPKSINMPVSNVSGTTNGSMMGDDYSWLDGFQMPSSTSSFRPSYPTNQVSYGHSGSSNGHIGLPGLPFSGMQPSGGQFQGGNLKPYSEYQPFVNMHPMHGQKLPEQQHMIMPGNQFGSQTEHHQGKPTWTGHYRV